MTDSQNRILDFRAKGTRKNGYCANSSHSTRVTDLKSSHDYKRKERQWSQSNRLDIIRSTIGGLSAAWQSRLVNSFQHTNGSAGVATRAPRAFVLRFFEPLSPLNAHNALIPSVSLARCGNERKKREEWRFNGELRRHVICVDWGWCWSFSWIMKWFWKFVCINV